MKILFCEDCGREVRERYNRTTDEKWVCFSCLPAGDIDAYPGWREKEALRQQRADQARKNFALSPTA